MLRLTGVSCQIKRNRNPTLGITTYTVMCEKVVLILLALTPSNQPASNNLSPSRSHHSSRIMPRPRHNTEKWTKRRIWRGRFPILSILARSTVLRLVSTTAHTIVCVYIKTDVREKRRRCSSKPLHQCHHLSSPRLILYFAVCVFDDLRSVRMILYISLLAPDQSDYI